MEVGYISDPNLDDDFRILLRIRQIRGSSSHIDDVHVSLHDELDGGTSTLSLQAIPDTPRIARKPSTTPTTPAKLRIKLLRALQHDDAHHFQNILDKGLSSLGCRLTDHDMRDKNSNATLLHTALENNCWNVAKYLIESSDDMLLADSYTITVRNVTSKKNCLHILSEKGNYDLTRLFLERFKDDVTKRVVLDDMFLLEMKGQQSRQLTSIHIASFKGQTEIVKLFVQLGVDVNTPNDKKETPVMWAVRGNHVSTVRQLIELEAKLTLENDEGATPFYWAVRYGFYEIVKFLLTESDVSVNQTRRAGLVAPIVLASVLGYKDIVEILLDNGSNANTKISSTQQTALHFASAEGNDTIVSVLIDKGRADVNHADINGNTAILFAAKSRNASTMKLLLHAGAFIDCRNKQDQNIWDFVMQGPGHEFLDTVIELYKEAKGFRDPITERYIIVFPAGRSPLHVAAMNGDVGKMRRLLELGVDPKTPDLNGNTYYHTAALHDCHHVLKTFADEVDVNYTNANGNSALQIAARNGNVNSVRFLLSKSDHDVRNKFGMTVLHEAVDSDIVNPSLVRAIVDFLVKNNKSGLLNAKDVHDNTALHVAARRGRLELFSELTLLDPMKANDDGDTPLHIAARNRTPRCLETMITIFNKPDKRINIDQKNFAGETVLHECARMGDAQRVELFVSCGADLALPNDAGNSALHILIEEINKQTNNKEALVQVYRAILRNAVKWWCMKHYLQNPTEPSEEYDALLRLAVFHLTTEVNNNAGWNVISFATQSGSVDLLYEILNTPNVYRIQNGLDYNYDISNLTPQTMITSNLILTNFKEIISTIPNLKTVSDASKSVTQTFRFVRENVACLDIVVALKDEEMAKKILDIAPLKPLVRDYWHTYQWLYIIFISVHIVYMSLYSVFVVPTYAQLQIYRNSTAGSKCKFDKSSGIFGLFLIWPVTIIIVEFYPILSEAIRYLRKTCRRFHSRKNQSVGSSKAINSNIGASRDLESFIYDLPYLIVITLFNYLSYMTSLLFCGSVIVWFILFMCSNDQQAYVEFVALVLIFGWLFTMSLSNGFKDLHMFTIMLKYIIIRDIARFLLIYIFTLMACGLAFHALFQISQTMAGEYTNVSLTVYNTFNLMMGLGSLWDNTFDSTYSSEGGNPGFVKAVYVMYVLLANIILMSLLVAMMTDTYTEVKNKEATTWRVGSLRLALRVEKSMPCLRRILRSVRLVRDRVTFDEKVNRWLMSVPVKEVDSLIKPASETGDMLKLVQRLEMKIDDLSQQVKAVCSGAKSDSGSGDTAVSEATMIADISNRTRVSRLNRNNSL